eukprot:6197913-Pleurochrysis_carterae.AAC.4
MCRRREGRGWCGNGMGRRGGGKLLPLHFAPTACQASASPIAEANNSVDQVDRCSASREKHAFKFPAICPGGQLRGKINPQICQDFWAAQEHDASLRLSYKFKATNDSRTQTHRQAGGSLRLLQSCHAPARQKAELAAFQSQLKRQGHKALQDNTTEKGKQAQSAFNSSYKRKHRGTFPGPEGRPFTSANCEQWVVNLHLLVDLNKGKLTWKWALLRCLPVKRAGSMLLAAFITAFACCLMQLTHAQKSDNFKGLGLGLDLRTKEEDRQPMDKF